MFHKANDHRKPFTNHSKALLKVALLYGVKYEDQKKFSKQNIVSLQVSFMVDFGKLFFFEPCKISNITLTRP